MDKFCPSCGRRIGFGVRSENEVRIALNRLDDATFTVQDIGLKQMIMSDVLLYSGVLSWVLGEKDEDPVAMIVNDIKMHGKVRSQNGAM